jgi:hypothetical protein
MYILKNFKFSLLQYWTWVLALVLCSITAPCVFGAAPPSAYLMSTNPPCDNPGFCETLLEIVPEFNRSWHIAAVEEVYADSGGLVRMDGDFLGPGKAPVLYSYDSRVFFMSVYGDDTLAFEYDGWCGTEPPRPPGPPPPIDPHYMVSCEDHLVIEWIDNGDSIFTSGDSLIMVNPNVKNSGEYAVEVISVNCGWYVEIAESIPTLTEWGLIIFGVLLAMWMAWIIARRKRRAPGVAL